MTPLEAWHAVNPAPEVPAAMPMQDGDGMGSADPRSTYTVIPHGEPFVAWRSDFPDEQGWYEPHRVWYNPGAYFHGWNDFWPWDILDDDEPVWAIYVVDPPQDLEVPK